MLCSGQVGLSDRDALDSFLPAASLVQLAISRRVCDWDLKLCRMNVGLVRFQIRLGACKFRVVVSRIELQNQRPPNYKAIVLCLGGSAVSLVYWIRKRELNEDVASGDGKAPQEKWTHLLGDRTILYLLLAVAVFHLANAPILPVTALYIKRLGGSSQLTTFTVFSAQLVMVPMAWVTGRLCDSWGRKPIMAVAFWVLPFRILSYTLAHNPHAVVFLQALDGIGAGIYSVAIVAFAADLTHGKGRFNALLGIFATAQGIGGVAGPIVSGLVLQHFGFKERARERTQKMQKEQDVDGRRYQQIPNGPSISEGLPIRHGSRVPTEVQDGRR